MKRDGRDVWWSRSVGSVASVWRTTS